MRKNYIWYRHLFGTHLFTSKTAPGGSYFILLIVVYRPPNSTSDLSQPDKLIDYAHSWYSKIIVTGHLWILTFSRRKATSAQSSVMLILLKVLETATRVNDKISTLIEHIYTIHPNRIVQSFVLCMGWAIIFLLLCTQISCGKMSKICKWWD